MEEMLKALMKKKGKEEIDPKLKDAKMKVLKEIHSMASDDMGEDIKGLKKVTVASPDQEGLEKGLEKAQEMVSGSEDSVEGEESPAKEVDEMGDLSPEEIQQMIEMLQKKLAK